MNLQVVGAWLGQSVEGAAHHGMALILVSVLGLVGGWILHWWRHREYGCMLEVRLCIVDPIPSKDEGKQMFFSETIWEGQATDYIHDLPAVQSLTRSSRKMRESGLLALKPKHAKKILTLCANQIRQRFAEGYMAKAMDDADVTQRPLVMGLFRNTEGTSQVTLLVMTTNDWAIVQKGNVHVSSESEDAYEWAQMLDERNSVRIRFFI